MKCSVCGAQLPEASTFCAECGNRVETTPGSGGSYFSSAGDLNGGGSAAPVPSIWDTYQQKTSAQKCPRCGAPVEEDEQFCMNCGQKLKEERKSEGPDLDIEISRKTVRGTGVPGVRIPSRASKPNLGLLLGIGAGALALILVVVIIGVSTSWFGLVGPGVQLVSAVKKTVDKGNFTMEFELSDGLDDIEGVALVNIDMKKRDVQLYMQMDMEGNDVVVAIYDGYFMEYYEEYDYGYAEKISSELDDLFDAYEAAVSGDREEMTDMLEDMGLDEDDLEDYVDLEALEKCIGTLVKKLNSKAWLKENAGYTTRRDGGATIHSLEPEMEEFLIAVLEIMEPAFQDEDDYEDIVDSVEDIDDVDVLVETGIKSGYLVSADLEVDTGYDELEIHAAFRDYGKTKIDVEELEELLDDCK